jgi:hypothetical protein
MPEIRRPDNLCLGLEVSASLAVTIRGFRQFEDLKLGQPCKTTYQSRCLDPSLIRERGRGSQASCICGERGRRLRCFGLSVDLFAVGSSPMPSKLLDRDEWAGQSFDNFDRTHYALHVVGHDLGPASILEPLPIDTGPRP